MYIFAKPFQIKIKIKQESNQITFISGR